MAEQKLKILELRDPDSEHARQAFTIYQDAFPVQEREAIEGIAAAIRATPALEPPDHVRHFSVAVTDSTVIGFAIFAYHHEVNLAFLEYMAIHPSVRGRGYGSGLFDQVVQQSAEDALRLGGPPPFGVCFEVERPVDARSEAERQMRERRIRFYLRRGAQLIQQAEFVAPPLGQGLPPVPYHLMFRPIADEPISLTVDDVERIIETILLRGYGLQRDSPYFRKAIRSIRRKG